MTNVPMLQGSGSIKNPWYFSIYTQVIIAILGGIVGGMIWALLVGLLKNFGGVNNIFDFPPKICAFPPKSPKNLRFSPTLPFTSSLLSQWQLGGN